MALVVADRVMETSTTTGTGALTLAGAVTGYRRFSAVCSTSDTLYYVIESVDSNGNPSGDWEVGLGTYSASNILTRTTPAASSNAGAAVNLSAGTKRVMLSATAGYLAAAIAAKTESFIIACSDETTALTTGTAKVTFRMPYAFTVTAVYASLTTAQTSGSIFTVDINEGGTSILSTKLTIDNTETDSATAATAAVISDASLAARAQITVDIDQIGDGTAKGLKVTLVGHQ